MAGRAVARATVIIGFALLTWAGARISVPLPMTPVPGTLQLLAVLLAGACLGPRGGALSQSAYLSMGAAGLPVFSLPGSGPGYFLGPTGGYLFGFVLAAWATGSLLESRPTGRAASALAFLCGAVTVHLCGFTWLAVFLGDPARALRAGVLPFVVFDLAKVLVATAIYAGCRRWMPRTTG